MTQFEQEQAAKKFIEIWKDKGNEKSEEKTEQKEEKEIPLTVIVKIDEDKVTINDTPVENAEELKKIVEDYNTDSRKFVLEENKSILETYKWVTGVFIDLGIALSGEG